VLGDGDRVCRFALLEEDLGAEFHGVVEQAGDPGALADREGVLAGLGQWLAAPQGGRGLDLLAGEGELTGAQRLAGPVHGLFEQRGVPGLAGHLQGVSRRVADQHGGAALPDRVEDRAQPADVGAHGGGGAGRPVRRPQVAQQGLLGDGAAVLEEQPDEQQPALSGSEVERGVAVQHLDGAEHAEPQRVCVA
jgi:hypothetical protein